MRLAAALLAFGLAPTASTLAAPKDSPCCTLTSPFGSSQTLAWSWGASNSGTVGAGGGSGAGRANLQDLSITRTTDGQSPQYVHALAVGTHLPTGESGRAGPRSAVRRRSPRERPTGATRARRLRTRALSRGRCEDAFESHIKHLPRTIAHLATEKISTSVRETHLKFLRSDRAPPLGTPGQVSRSARTQSNCEFSGEVRLSRPS